MLFISIIETQNSAYNIMHTNHSFIFLDFFIIILNSCFYFLSVRLNYCYNKKIKDYIKKNKK